jgi:hypothetical protein
VARLPAPTNEESISVEEDRFRSAVADLAAQGKTPPEIARALAPNDPKRRKTLRSRIWALAYRERDFAARVQERVFGKMLFGLGPATDGLVARASRGRPDAIKLLYEASGFHNPRVKHEHSGDIKIKLEMPRPEGKTVEAEVEEIQDAEVVDP